MMPREPQGLGAIVRDQDGDLWVREGWGDWHCLDGVSEDTDWDWLVANVDPTVLSRGFNEDGTPA